MSLAASASAQDATGRILGRVLDGDAGAPVASAQVTVEGSGIGVLTDVDGRYLLRNVPPGTLSVTVSSIGYATKMVTDVVVSAGETTGLDISLATKAVELEALTVSAERERGSTAFLLDERRTSSSILDAVGEARISRSPDSDAAEVASRLTGVTISEGKYVHVRGLGERYSQTSLNGSPLPSPEPEKETVPLDLFPSDFLQSLTMQKSYSPDLPGDFSGGMVAIRTKEFPDRFRMHASVTTSVNTESQFRDDFLSYPGGDLDFLGVDDGSRDLPDAVKAEIGGLDGQRLPANEIVRARVGQAFQRRFTPEPRRTPLNRSFDLSMGTREELFDREIGMLVAVTYSDRYLMRDEIERKWRASAFDPSLAAERRLPNVAYDFDRGTRSVSWGTIANFHVLLSPEHKIGLKTTYNRNSDDEARTFIGANREDLGGEITSDRLRFVSRSLLWAQLSGEHGLPFESHLEWRATRARATRDEPGLREAIYLRSFGADENEPFLLENIGGSGRYFFSDLTDDDLNGEVDLRVPIGRWAGRDAVVEIGGAYRMRNRDFAARRFNWEFQSGSITNIDSALTDATIVGAVNDPGQFAISEVVEPGDQYQIEDDRSAGYALLELPVVDGLRAVGGARVERYTLALDSRGETVTDRDHTRVMPSLSVIYDISGRMSVRAAASRTFDRPEFRELAPFQFTEATSLRQIFGNPDLVAAEVRSADLRWDYFPRPGELFSVGAFYKGLDDPIEQVFLAAASAAYSYQNANDGRIYGVELDARKRLDFVADALSNLSVGGNLTLIDSEVHVTKSGAFLPTNEVRPLEGQSSYTANVDITWADPRQETEVSLFYNVFGPRVSAAGGSGIPDIYEQPRHQLDFVLKRQLAGDLKLKLKATNLLGEDVLYEQSRNGVTLTQRRYDLGRTFSVGLSADL